MFKLILLSSVFLSMVGTSAVLQFGFLTVLTGVITPILEGLSTPVIYITLLITITLWIYRRIPKDNDLGFLHI